MARSGVLTNEADLRRLAHTLHAGLDLSRRRLDYWLLDELGERVEVTGR